MSKVIELILFTFLFALLVSCSDHSTQSTTEKPGEHPPLYSEDTLGECQGNCDATPPTYPELFSWGGQGDVTTYGSVEKPASSQGGACNYGSTNIMAFAAIQVHLQPGDDKGSWQQGRACGKCALVRARTPSGWKSTIVRITDKCADTFCGIDLGGLPAQTLMQNQPGRYAGEWEWVNCTGAENVSDGPTALHVKEGSNEWWSLVQMRNGPSSVATMEIRKFSSDKNEQAWISLPWASEAENFFKVPESVLQDSSVYELRITWDVPVDSVSEWQVQGTDLAKPGTLLHLTSVQ